MTNGDIISNTDAYQMALPKMGPRTRNEVCRLFCKETEGQSKQDAFKTLMWIVDATKSTSLNGRLRQSFQKSNSP